MGSDCAINLTRIVPNYSAKFCGIILSNPELAAGKRRKIPHLRKDDGFRICFKPLPPAGSDSGRRGMNKPIRPHIKDYGIWKSKFSNFFIRQKWSLKPANKALR